MTRLPWQHSRSRTKSGSEKTSLTKPQDWFSKTNAEPSRQALSDLVKAHNRVRSDESHTAKSRTRNNTISSVLSQRGHSRAESEDDAWSRPSSRGTHEESIHSAGDRSEGSAKALVAKGNQLLKRTSSRMSLSSAASSPSMHGLTSPTRSSRALTSARSDDLRTKISAPFHFEHVVHTEETQFTGLHQIDEGTLVDQYVAVTTKQHVASHLRGISVSALDSLSSNEQHHAISSDVAVPASSPVLQELPQTPPRPQPPPKDDVTPVRELREVLHPDQAAEDDDTKPSGLDLKPLPQLPVIHAITTEDNSARAMITNPLPSPPLSTVPVFDVDPALRPAHQRLTSLNNFHGAPRNPANKSSMPNLVAANHLLAAPKVFPRYHSDMALSKQAKTASATASTRTSMSFAAIDTMNWEEAVDEAWDFIEDDYEHVPGFSFLSLSTDRDMEHGQRSDLSTLESAGSTPLMMASMSCAAPCSPDRASFSHNVEVHQLESVKEDEPTNGLAGLGISACPASGTSALPRLSRSSSTHFPKRRSSLSCYCNDTLTRSSSQESIIRSIVSSINGTQRSSSSSVSAMDLAGICASPVGGPATEADNCHEDEGDGESFTGQARPESGCLPPDALEQISHFGTAFSSERTSMVEDMPSVPVVPDTSHGKFTTKVSVPERSSSIIATTRLESYRKRSNTWGSRPRQSSHTSYSLFPAAQPPSCVAVTTS